MDNTVGVNNSGGLPIQRIGSYEIKSLLGRGGMAQVYRAYQPSLDRYVAIKVLSQSLASDSTFIERFKREAKSIARLRHPNIVSIYDFGEERGLYYLVMELLDGRTLQDEVRSGPIPGGRVLEVMDQVGSALTVAHNANIIHRDIKPTNILCDGPHRLVLSDFGIAKQLDQNTLLTQSGYSVGTPDYMSPEQALGQPLDPRSDQYSLAVVLYQMMTGRTPFQADSAVVVLAAHINNPPPPPRQLNPTISSSVEGIILRGLAKDPQQRFRSVSDMVRALQQEMGAAKNMNTQARTVIGNAPVVYNPPPTTARNQPPIPNPQPTTQRNAPSPYPAQPTTQRNQPAYPQPGYGPSTPSGMITNTPRVATADALFGYKGIPGAPPIPKGALGTLPPPLPRRGGAWLFLLILLFLIMVALIIVLAYILVPAAGTK